MADQTQKPDSAPAASDASAETPRQAQAADVEMVPAPAGPASRRHVPASRRGGGGGRLILRLFQWVSLVTLLALVVLIFTPAGSWLGRGLVSVDGLQKADYILVLGGDWERAVEAANLYRQGWASKVIISSESDDAELLQRVAEEYGVPKEAITLDCRPHRTADHPITVAQIPGVDYQATRFIIVTSAYHTSRVRACFRHFGYNNICMRCPDWLFLDCPRQEDRNPLGRSRDLGFKVYEYLAWGLYKIHGWV